MDTNIVFRPAKKSDSFDMAPLVIASAPETVDYLYQSKSRSAVEFIRYSLATDAGYLGYSIYHVALKDNEIVAVYANYDHKNSLRKSAALIKSIVAFYSFPQCLLVICRLIRLLKLTPLPEKGANYLASISVDSSFKAQGIGTAIINKMIDHSKDQGYKALALDVSIDNTHARNLYQRMGFIQQHINHAKIVGKVPSLSNTYRMVYPLV